MANMKKEIKSVINNFISIFKSYMGTKTLTLRK